MKVRDVNDILREDGVDALRRALDTAVPVYTTDDAAAERRATKPASPKPRAPKDQPGPERRTQAQALLDIALGDGVELFRTRDNTAYADIDFGERRETWAIRSRAFRRWLQGRYYEQTGGTANTDAMSQAMGVIEGRAQFGGAVREVYLRVAAAGNAVYIDIGDETWRAIEIDAIGWRIVQKPPVRFRRSPYMLPLCEPERGGKIDELRAHLNVDDATFKLVVGFVLQALRGRGPYPLLTLLGEQGTGKSTAAKNICNLIDPNVAALRGPPRDLRDLAIAAFNAYLLAFDNLSGIPADLADALCRLLTGGAFSTRSLYTDDEEKIFEGMRPVITSSITDIATRSDLADRALAALLQRIEDIGRKTETELERAFRAARPRILGALLDAVSQGLRNECDGTHALNRMPRMADHAQWVRRCEPALPWGLGDHLAAYEANRGEAAEMVVEADPVASALRMQLGGNDELKLSATDLLGRLAANVPDHVKRAREWPRDARALSGRLRRLAPALRRIGVVVTFEREGLSSRKVVRVRPAPRE